MSVMTQTLEPGHRSHHRAAEPSFAFVDQPWADQALCAQTDPDAFFPEKGGSTRNAKKVCVGCDVRAECLTWALDNGERFGIWGGLSERERRAMRAESTCPHCDRIFTTASNRDRHITLRHNPDNPHACHLCGQTFRYSSTLDRHIQQGSFDNPRHMNRAS